MQRNLTIRLAGLLVVFVGLMNAVYYLAEREGPHAYASYGEALVDSLILLFSGWSLSDPPATRLGFLAAFAVLIAGIAFVALLIGEAASFLVSRAIAKDRGLRRLRMKDHILVCNWNGLSRGLVDQLQSDEASRTNDIVVVADLAEHPYPESGVAFVSGPPTRDDVLRRAAIDKASTAIITGNDGDSLMHDSVAILTALAIEAQNPNVYTCVQIFDPANRSHLRHAHADEVVCVGEMASGVLAQAALNHGLTSLLHQLMAFGEGSEIYKVRLPETAHGMPFSQLARVMLDDHNAMLLAIEGQRNGSREVFTCPSTVTACRETDAAFVYAESFPVGLLPATRS